MYTDFYQALSAATSNRVTFNPVNPIKKINVLPVYPECQGLRNIQNCPLCDTSPHPI